MATTDRYIALGILLVYLSGYLFLQKINKKLKTWVTRTNITPQYLLKILQALRVKFVLLWGFTAIWFIVNIFHQHLWVHIVKGISSFLLCLVVGDIVAFVSLTCFGRLVKNITQVYPLLTKLCLWAFTTLGLIVLAHNLGFSISGLLTTLGIGGAAVAFAAQNTLANLWAALSIFLDRPFKEGDSIVVGTKASGKVLSLGIRSTRLQTEKGTVVVVPNTVIVNECIENKNTRP